jgi:nitrogen regulatory protein PII
MKLIVAIVKPFKVTELVDALRQEPGTPGMTVVSVQGFGRGRESAPSTQRGASSNFTAHEMILVAAPEGRVERLVELISQTAHTGRPGDGKVLVLPLEAALAITTGERGEAALA